MDYINFWEKSFSEGLVARSGEPPILLFLKITSMVMNCLFKKKKTKKIVIL